MFALETWKFHNKIKFAVIENFSTIYSVKQSLFGPTDRIFYDL